jgi:hypothetical protein
MNETKRSTILTSNASSYAVAKKRGAYWGLITVTNARRSRYMITQQQNFFFEPLSSTVCICLT